MELEALMVAAEEENEALEDRISELLDLVVDFRRLRNKRTAGSRSSRTGSPRSRKKSSTDVLFMLSYHSSFSYFPFFSGSFKLFPNKVG